MAKYRLIGGDHEDEKGKRFVKGQVITTDEELDKTFPNKWERVDVAPSSEDEEADKESEKTDASKKTPSGKFVSNVKTTPKGDK